jgi:ATP-dependent helicase/nuclease subunit A
LRRQASSELHEEAANLFPQSLGPFAPLNEASSGVADLTTLSAAEVGRVHHQFLQRICLDQAGSAAALREEAGRLQQAGHLSLEQAAVLDYESLARFWNSDLGKRIRARSALVRRELAFTVRFSPAELASLLGQPLDTSLTGELILVQGVADLAVIAPEAIWLVDFKTDQLNAHELASRVKAYEPQVRLYARALSLIYHRPVTESWLYFLSLNQAVPVQAIPDTP